MAETFDPFGWKGMFKDTLAGFMDGLSEKEDPSKMDEDMILEIFEKFDLDKDGLLNLEEFNSLQLATEGSEAVYNLEQLKQLLADVNDNIESPEKGMPFADYRRIYVSPRFRRKYNTDIARDHVKIFGIGGGIAGAAAAAMTEAAAAKGAAALKEGAAVRIDGLAGATELNGQQGQLVTAVESEAAMVAEGRLIVQLANGDRVALKAGNIKPAGV